MKLILDEGVPLRTAELLRQKGVEATHILELGMGGASDCAVLEKASLDGAVLVTRDADFHQILATTGARFPSVIRVRIESIPAQRLASILLDVLERTGEEIRAGAAVSIGPVQVRLRRLPIRA